MICFDLHAKQREETVRQAVYKATGTEPWKELPAYAWPGGYPIAYYDWDFEPVCATCVNTDTWEGKHIIAADIHWEGPEMQCANCKAAIEEEYGQEEEM